MSNFNCKIDEEDLEDIIYYNADYINMSDTSKKAIFAETRKDIIVYNPNLYYLSLVRWSIDLNDIPIMLYPSTDDGSPINSTYIVTLKYNNNNYYGYVNYVSQDVNQNDTQFLPNPIYSVQHFLDMVNLAYRNAFISAVNGGLGGPYVDAPFLWFDVNNNKINMVVPSYYISSGLVKVCMNSNLYVLFASLRYLYNSNDEVANSEYEIVLKNTGNNTGSFTYPITNNTVQSTIIYSEFYNIYNLISVRKIIITTSKIPSSEQLITNYGFINSNSSSDDKQRIISDYVIPNNFYTDFDSQLTYYPSAEYNLVELKGTVPIKEIDLYFYWVDDKLNIYPIIIFPKNGLSVKLMFRKKSYNSILTTRLLCNIRDIEQEQNDKNKGGKIYKTLKY